ncbi:hypothetical protein QBC37DRAFT_400677 [Rhypophila decipiens]|uniref:Uncharacterized protein n=1 Tax=Rhypophila decipiens TaxID=261697 RepID=A0AAN6YC16_9PEZI|nr:hypothetical protein QBC37DRAFT_400677 [Rhypophila decipiens]
MLSQATVESSIHLPPYSRPTKPPHSLLAAACPGLGLAVHVGFFPQKEPQVFLVFLTSAMALVARWATLVRTFSGESPREDSGEHVALQVVWGVAGVHEDYVAKWCLCLLAVAYLRGSPGKREEDNGKCGLAKKKFRRAMQKLLFEKSDSATNELSLAVSLVEVAARELF